tara:strand:- start:60 stop:314 length:255 start_codon:yes stop_codon:yes gene_type:complete
MARPVIYINQTKCAQCDVEMEPRKHKKPFKKLCPECKSKAHQGNVELKKMFKELKERNSKMTNEELGISTKSFKNNVKGETNGY